MEKTLISETNKYYVIATGRGTCYMLRKIINAMDVPYSTEEKIILDLLNKCCAMEKILTFRYCCQVGNLKNYC